MRYGSLGGQDSKIEFRGSDVVAITLPLRVSEDMNKVLATGFLAVFFLSACSQSIQDYQHNTPALDLHRFFQGQAQAFGMMQDWQGKQNLHFTARLCGQWQGARGDLYEIFQFSDGRTDKRHWQLTTNGAQVIGTAGDVVGEANGTVAGNSMQFDYVLRIATTDGPVDVTVRDWMYLVSPSQLINKSTLHKYGLQVGELTLAIQQLDASASCAEFIAEFARTQVSPPTP